MQNEIAIQISYKGSGGGLLGLEDFIKKLKEDYIITIKPDTRPQSGGIFDSLIHLIVNTSLNDFIASMLLYGLSWDLVKKGTKSYLIRPFLDAIEKFENENERLDYSSLSIEYDDAIIYFYGIRRGFISSLGFVFNEIHANYHTFFFNDKGEIHEIHVPIVNYNDEGLFVRGDIMYECDLEMCKGYWGLSYNLGFEKDIWDVKNRKFLNKEWSIQPKLKKNIDVNEKG